LASDPTKHPPTPDLKSSDIEVLEKEMDKMDGELPQLKNFILPGGHPTVSICHVCRTVCRRAERLTVALSQAGEPVEALVLQYLNRLSDYFFVLARYMAQEFGAEEFVWKTR
jgi:cob(I)alamin adenosyltransferase